MFRSVLSHRTRTHGGNGSSERLSKQLIDLFESCVFAVRKKKILLRGVMTRKRVIHYPKIITMFNVKSIDFIEFSLFYIDISVILCQGRQKSKPFTLAQAAGHGSFVMLALSYLESDFLNLRLYAVSGVCLSILFQYYREIPLWLPISWNCLFLGINYVMIALLYKETSDAKNLTTEQRYECIECPFVCSTHDIMLLYLQAIVRIIVSNTRRYDKCRLPEANGHCKTNRSGCRYVYVL